MKIVTAADANYFDFLLELIVACKGFLGTLPDVYNLGLLKGQADFLRLAGMKVFFVPEYPDVGKYYPEGYRPTALFKPTVLLDAAYRTAEPILWMDADAKPVDFFEFPDVELGIAKAHDKVIASYAGTDIAEYVGPYHTSVIFLGESDKRTDFLLAWETDMWNDENPSDMKSLNRIIRNNHGLKLSELEEDIWNSTTKYPHTKIVHIQGPVVR